MLVSPVWRGALNAGSVLYAMITIVIQTTVIMLLALALGADYRGGVGGVLICRARGVCWARRLPRSPTASRCSPASARR